MLKALSTLFFGGVYDRAIPTFQTLVFLVFFWGGVYDKVLEGSINTSNFSAAQPPLGVVSLLSIICLMYIYNEAGKGYSTQHGPIL